MIPVVMAVDKVLDRLAAYLGHSLQKIFTNVQWSIDQNHALAGGHN